MQKIEVSKLAEKIGVQEDNITTGEFKQPISLFKPIDEEGEEYIKKQLMDPTYELFVDYIVENRGIDKAIVKSEYADGRVFIANECVGTLVDEIMTFHQLLARLTDSAMKVKYVNIVKKSFKEKLGFTINVNIPQLESIGSGLKLE